MKNKIAKEQIRKLIGISQNTVKALLGITNSNNELNVLRQYFLSNINILKGGGNNNDKRDKTTVRRRRKRMPKKV